MRVPADQRKTRECGFSKGLMAQSRSLQPSAVGVHELPSGPNAVRAVFYRDITDSDVDRASELVGESLGLPGLTRGRNPFSQ
jgi:hypothetical protein